MKLNKLVKNSSIFYVFIFAGITPIFEKTNKTQFSFRLYRSIILMMSTLPVSHFSCVYNVFYTDNTPNPNKTNSVSWDCHQ